MARDLDSLTELHERSQSAYFYDSSGARLHIKISGANSDWEEIRVVR